MKVWVYYEEYVYDGCSKPLAAFSTEAAAKEYLSSRRDRRVYGEIVELELDHPAD